MSSAVNMVTAADAVAAVKQQQGASRAQKADGGRFKDMLSDAVNTEAGTKPGEAVKPQKTAENANIQEKPAKTEPHTQETERTKPQEQRPVQDEQEEDDIQAYGRQAAMQMQFIAPVIADMSQPEIPEETEAVEAISFQSVQATESAITAETPQIAGEPPLQLQDTPEQEVKDKDDTAQTLQAPAETQVRQAKTVEAAVEQVMGQTAGAVQQEQTAQAESPRTDLNRPQIQEKSEATPEIAETAANDITDVQIIRQHQAVQMHNLRHPQKAEEAAARFDSMLAKASQELNPNAAVEEPQAEGIPEEAPIMEQPIVFEAKPQEADAQTEIPEDIIPDEKTKPQEEAKPEAQADVQKSVKASATEQRPQKEISKTDKAALEMVQPEQQTATHEVMRSEPAQQPGRAGQVQVPEQAEQIRAQVIKSMENQRTEFQMQLNPEELGKINIKMILEDGKLSVEIMALNPKSAELLSKQAESLAASLKTGSIEVSTVNVVTAAENASANMNSEYNLNNFQNQFRNQSDGQAQSGHSSHRGTSQEQTENGEQDVRKKSQTPKRILNYEV